MLKVRDLTFRYQGSDKPVWENINLSVERGQFAVVKGGNGTGKSTLLHCLCGIIPNAVHGNMFGEITWQNESLTGKPLKYIADKVNILFQEPDKQLFMPIVEEEIAFGPENFCLSSAEIRVRIAETLEMLGIENLRHDKTSTLSFGQKKLVALASILTISPDLLLIDEFSAGMSDSYVERMIKVFKQLSQLGKCIVFAEHDQRIIDLADVLLDLGEERLSKDSCQSAIR
jgi:energy-coupling factor transport system ATP-binding protein